LASGRHYNNLLRRKAFHLPDIDKQVIRNLDATQLRSDPYRVFHTPSGHSNTPAILSGTVDDLLDPIDVRSKSSYDYSLGATIKQLVNLCADIALRSRIAGLFHIC
jgi:hypothetical protein